MEEALNLTATLSLATALGELWDVIVIGAGPAGAVTARQLALAGQKTLLVDHQAFPRAKVCGGYLNGRAVAALGALGLESALAATRPVDCRRFVVHAAGRRAELALSAGAVIERATFDAALVEAAVQAGAEFLPQTRATVEADHSADFRSTQLRQHGEAQGVVKSRIVVSADGLGHPSLQRLPEFEGRVDERSRVGVGISLRDDGPAYEPGVIYMAVAPEGYVGLARAAEGRINVAGAIDPQALKYAPGPVAAATAILRQAGLPLPAMLSAEGWRGAPALSRSSARLAASRVFLIGDSAGYVEPFTGEGMAWAISSAIAVVPYAIRSTSRWDQQLVQEWETLQRQRMQKGQSACRLLAKLLRQPWTVSIGLRILACAPALAGPLVRRLSAASVGAATD